MNVDLSRLMATEEKPGDYVGSDGLLYCGKCHTPKQMWLSFDPSTGGKKQTLVHLSLIHILGGLTPSVPQLTQ